MRLSSGIHLYKNLFLTLPYILLSDKTKIPDKYFALRIGEYTLSTLLS